MNPHVVLVHGSPGAPSELAPLCARLGERGCHTHVVRMPLRDARPLYTPIAEAARNADVIVAYSYGCYLTARALESAQLAGKRLCFVSPHFVGSDGLSLVVRGLLGIPGLGERLLRRGLDARIEDYLARTFAPAAAPDLLRRELADPRLWLRAAGWKEEQAAHPLPPLDPPTLASFHVVLGEADASSPWSEQARVFAAPLPETRITRIAGAGHALPWTHPERVADAIVLLGARADPRASTC